MYLAKYIAKCENPEDIQLVKTSPALSGQKRVTQSDAAMASRTVRTIRQVLGMFFLTNLEDEKDFIDRFNPELHIMETCSVAEEDNLG
ncbi:hypothetical protein BV898_12570 [Hypsibius exemplaris]|uniref:Uncharacterized protein n=1 Tax=Hypsibius exemplaris TaxID=2072580 RepID=A0A1W0WDH2_HYPEX|nr:hypothetical protein BV898_12570 [Hypsibius exemplaris]